MGGGVEVEVYRGVPDQNGITQACYLIEIYHSGPDPSIIMSPVEVCLLLVYLRGVRDAQTVLSAATLRQKLQIKVSISPSHSILTPGQPVPALTL